MSARRLMVFAVIVAILGTTGYVVARDTAEQYEVFGSRQPRAPGDTATLCAVDVTSPRRWALASSVKHVAIMPNGAARISETYDARSACRPLLWERGVLTDTLPVRAIVWRLTPQGIQRVRRGGAAV